MKDIKWIKNYKNRKIGEIGSAGDKSAENFVSQGFAEYVESSIGNRGANSLKSNYTSNISKPNNSVKSKKSDMNDMFGKSQQKNQQKTSSIGNEGKNKVKSNSDNKKESKTFTSTGKGKEESKGLICDMNDMNDVFASQSSPNISNISHITTLQKAFGSGLLESIFKHFIINLNVPVPYSVVAKGIGITVESVRNPINRNKYYFEEGSKDGKNKTFCLSDYGLKHCFNILKLYERRMKEVKENMTSIEKKEIKLEKLRNKINSLIDDLELNIRDKKVILDFEDICLWDLDLSELLLDSPDDILPAMKEELKKVGIEDMRIRNLPKTDSVSVERIRSKHIGKLINISGRCVSLSNVRPVTTMVSFECPTCGTLLKVRQLGKKLKEPSSCTCGRRSSFKEIDRTLEDQARIILEDLQEKTDNANTQRIDCLLKDNLTLPKEIEVFTPGEELEVIGIVREVKNINKMGEDTKLGLQVEIIHAELMEEEVCLDKFTDEEVEQFKELSNKIDKQGLSAINKSFAPEVYGYEQHKNAIIMQCCTKRNEPKVSSTRNKLSLLLIGDPGIAKTVLGKFAISITPHSKMAAGGGSSAVGITASVVKEDESMGGYRVEPGAMVLAKELLFLDELNNLTDEDKPKLQQGMSEQQISINKANLHVNLKVQSGILATANPIKGHFVTGANIFKQFNISSPILNRFDAIFVMKDIANKERDNAIAEIMIKRRRGEIKKEYDREFLRKYFVYIRSAEEPMIPDEIIEKVKEVYSDFRKYKNDDVMINPRFIESLTRFMEASAKLRLSNTVSETDLKRSLNILSASHFNSSDWNDLSNLDN
jgi:replicative DNA helicase Mcm